LTVLRWAVDRWTQSATHGRRASGSKNQMKGARAVALPRSSPLARHPATKCPGEERKIQNERKVRRFQQPLDKQGFVTAMTAKVGHGSIQGHTHRRVKSKRQAPTASGGARAWSEGPRSHQNNRLEIQVCVATHWCNDRKVASPSKISSARRHTKFANRAWFNPQRRRQPKVLPDSPSL
jgi:hypothetical protein